MFAIGLIVFREALEAALFIGVMAAATKGIPKRSQWLFLGLLVGVLGSLILAFGMGYINDWAQGTGQDWLQVVILGLAFMMLTWHIVWSQKHGREMVQTARELGHSVQYGKKSLAAIAIAVSMIVMREGAETVLFVSGAVAANAPAVTVPMTAQDIPLSGELDLTKNAEATANSSEVLDLTTSVAPQAPLNTELDLTQGAVADPKHNPLPDSLDLTGQTAITNESMGSQEPPLDIPESTASPTTSNTDLLIGGLGGLFLGVFLGIMVYQGLSRIALKHLFSVTNGLVVLLAAGMASQIGRIFVQMGILPSGANPLWDSSAWLANDDAFGVLLNALMGYDAQPSQTQVVFFVLGLLLILLMWQWGKRSQPRNLMVISE